MTTYKLYYFPARGAAEGARWLFAHAGVEFEDVRLSGEEWAKKKTEMPFGQMPVLEVIDASGSSTLIPQSQAISRYLAKEFKLDGSNNLESSRADFLNEFLLDSVKKLPFTEHDEEKRNKLMKEAIEGPFAENLATLEKFVQPSGYLVSDQVTWADISFAGKAEVAIQYSATALDKTPKLKKLYEKISCSPNIKAWLSKRPYTTR